MAARRIRMVKGPATVTVQGSCHVLGSNVSGQTISVRAGKALPFEPSYRCRLHVRLGRGGRIWTADPVTAGTAMWHGIVRKILALASEQKSITVMLAGDTDTGKSTLSAYIANMALANGMKPCIIDGDIGQGDLAPPSAIGAEALSRQTTDLRDIRASLFEFVGSISPVGIEHFVTGKLRVILDRCRPLGDIIIVNTDGYVKDGGVSYKMHLAEELKPDAIVCLGEDLPLFDELRSGPWQVLRAKASSQAYKSRTERIGRRLDQFLRHVGDGSASIYLEQITFVYMDKTFSPHEILQPPIKQLEPENMEGMFVGLAGSENNIEGFGVISSINHDKLHVQTDVQAFSRVYLSNIRLGKDMATEIKI
ncbi:MAG TPA: Clp1/GlmU family protein [Nitrososphaera sp.]|nr:Clp1/GlmU family protein [Nitrososphaera sp.]